jgi:hypothetical protein
MTLISLYTITFFIDSGLRQTNHPTWKAWNDILTRKSECEIYIQGSSRAWVQVSPLIIENYTGKKTYNFGIDGHHIDVQLGRYYLYRKYNKKPKIIIQILEGFSLEKRTDLYMKEQFLPYYNEECVVNSIKTMKGFNNIGHKLSFLKYIGETNTSIIGVLEKINIRHYKPVGIEHGAMSLQTLLRIM